MLRKSGYRVSRYTRVNAKRKCSTRLVMPLDINDRAHRALAGAQPEFLSQGRTSKTDPKSDLKPLIASHNQTAQHI